MRCPSARQDDDTRKSFSALLKDVSDEHLKRLRAKTVRKIVPDARRCSGASSGEAGARKEKIDLPGRKGP